MSTQYIDGSFGETKAFPEAMEEFMNAVDSNTAKAFHVGTFDEIEMVKEEVSNSDKIQALQAQVADMEAVINKNKIIAIPTYAEIKEISEPK